MIGTQFAKPLQEDTIIDPKDEFETIDNPAPNTYKKYSEAALWCNQNHATIEDKGEYYEVVALPETTLDEVKGSKLAELAYAFDAWRTDGATLISSLGFEADADEKANDDVAGLVTLGASATFMDANNQPHSLTIDQLKILQKEIIESGVSAYETKWTYRNAINSAETVDAVNAIEIKFEPKDFSATA